MARFALVTFLVVGLGQPSFAAEPAKGLKGTWVREVNFGPQIMNQLVLSFTDSRMTAKFYSGTLLPDGKPAYVAFEIAGEYAVTKSGIVCMVLSGVECDAKNLPSDSADSIMTPEVAKMHGQCLTFRADIDGSELHLTNLVVPIVATGGESGFLVAMASGSYKSHANGEVPFPLTKNANKTKEPVADESIEAMWRKFWFNDMPSNLRQDRLDPPVAPAPFVINQYKADPSVKVSQVPLPYGQPPTPPAMPVHGQIAPLPAAQAVYAPVGTPTTATPGAVIPVAAELALPGKPMATNDGVWVREMVMAGGGMQIVLQITGDRIKAKFIECGYVEGDDKLRSGSFEFHGTIATTADGYVVGRCLGAELELSNAPLDGIEPETFKGIHQANGEPFCFRVNRSADGLFISDVRFKMTDDMKDMAAAVLTGTFKSSLTAKPPLPNVPKGKKPGKLFGGSNQPAPMPNVPSSYLPPAPRHFSDMVPPLPVTHANLPQQPITTASFDPANANQVIIHGPPPPALMIERNAIPTTIPAPGSLQPMPIPREMRRNWEKSAAPPPVIPPASK
jgi:hypothetical protein